MRFGQPTLPIIFNAQYISLFIRKFNTAIIMQTPILQTSCLHIQQAVHTIAFSCTTWFAFRSLQLISKIQGAYAFKLVILYIIIYVTNLITLILGADSFVSISRFRKPDGIFRNLACLHNGCPTFICARCYLPSLLMVFACWNSAYRSWTSILNFAGSFNAVLSDP